MNDRPRVCSGCGRVLRPKEIVCPTCQGPKPKDLSRMAFFAIYMLVLMVVVAIVFLLGMGDGGLR